MTEFAPPNPQDRILSPKGASIDRLSPVLLGAEEYMANLGGELQGKSITAGWDIQPRKEGKPSEDTAYIFENNHGQTFIGVFDGMGGHAAGDMAANTAREVLHGYASRNRNVHPGGVINDFFPDAADAIEKRIEESQGSAEGAGTTGLIGIITEKEDGTKVLQGAGVGDSLGYLVRRDGSILQLNREESMRQAMLDQGAEEGVADNHGNVILNAISPTAFKGVNERFEYTVSDGDVVVFTSDGITGDKSTQRLAGGNNEAVIAQVAQDKSLSPKEKAQKLIQLATKTDDRTALFVEVQGKKASSQPIENDLSTLDTAEQPKIDHETTVKAGRISGILNKVRARQDARNERARMEQLQTYAPDARIFSAIGEQMAESTENDTKIVKTTAEGRLNAPLVELGNRALTEIWVVGSTFIGVVDHKDARTGKWKGVDVLLLPFGGAAGGNQSSVKLHQSDERDGFSTIEINRASLERNAGALGQTDAQVSKNHLTVIPKKDGVIIMGGKSTNGTFILDGSTPDPNGDLRDLVDYIKNVNVGVTYPSDHPERKLIAVLQK